MQNINEPIPASLIKLAINSSSCAVTIADATTKEMPLIYVNDTFESVTGYSKQETIGRNCRFLQGKDKEQIGIQKIRLAIANQKQTTVTLKNYRKDGSLFWNELHIAPIFNNKQLTHYVGIQTDVTQRVEAEKALMTYQTELENIVKERTESLHAKNIALTELVSQVGIEKKKLEEQMLANINEVILPTVRQLQLNIDGKNKRYIDTLFQNLTDITSSFGVNISHKLFALSPHEIQICNLIKSGLSSKDIANYFSVSLSTIENQRNSIRKKLGISQKKVNLSTFLTNINCQS